MTDAVMNYVVSAAVAAVWFVAVALGRHLWHSGTVQKLAAHSHVIELLDNYAYGVVKGITPADREHALSIVIDAVAAFSKTRGIAVSTTELTTLANTAVSSFDRYGGFEELAKEVTAPSTTAAATAKAA